MLVNSNPATIMTDPEFWPTPPTSSRSRPTWSPRSSSGAARRPAADHGRADRAEHRPDARAKRRAGAARRRADRRQGETPSTRPRTAAVPRGDGQDRPGEPARGCAIPSRARRWRRCPKDIGLPAIIRPSFTLGGTGGGIAYNREEFEEIVDRGLRASPTTEVLIEESVLGWKEFEMEVVRDRRPTTASSSARSRTSTRWASTPATRSPWRRP